VRAALRIHDLSLELHRTRAQLVEQERKNAVTELAGSAAHALNQPLAAIKLNLHLLELLDRNDERFVTALHAVKGDADRLGDLIEKMRGAAGNERLEYHAGKKVIDL
jgi:signal transduction histidine kinase